MGIEPRDYNDDDDDDECLIHHHIKMF